MPLYTAPETPLFPGVDLAACWSCIRHTRISTCDLPLNLVLPEDCQVGGGWFPLSTFYFPYWLLLTELSSSNQFALRFAEVNRHLLEEKRDAFNHRLTCQEFKRRPWDASVGPFPNDILTALLCTCFAPAQQNYRCFCRGTSGIWRDWRKRSFPAAKPIALGNCPDPSSSTPSPLPPAMGSNAPPDQGSKALGEGLCVGSHFPSGCNDCTRSFTRFLCKKSWDCYYDSINAKDLLFKEANCLTCTACNSEDLSTRKL